MPVDPPVTMATFPANFFDIADSLCGQSLSKLSCLSSHFEFPARTVPFENSTFARISARLINGARLLRVVQKSRVAIATLGDRMTERRGRSSAKQSHRSSRWRRDNKTARTWLLLQRPEACATTPPPLPALRKSPALLHTTA